MDSLQFNQDILKRLTCLESIVLKLAHQDSLLGFYIVLNVLIHHYQGKALLQKQLFLSLSQYSMMGLRYQLDKLINDELIYMTSYQSDKRMKLIKPSEKLIQISLKIMSNTGLPTEMYE